MLKTRRINSKSAFLQSRLNVILFFIPRTSLYRGSLNRGSTVLNIMIIRDPIVKVLEFS